MGDRGLELVLADDAATARLGEDLAAAARPGDVFALSGDLGAGKTTLARGFIRAMADASDLDVPSPTFTIVQSYPARIPVHHFDLYRLTDPGEVDELGLDEAVADGIALIEWPERAGTGLPSGRTEIKLAEWEAGRKATISGPPETMARIARSLDIRAFLDGAGRGTARRAYLVGDASTRSYEMVGGGDDWRILMNAPAMPDGPPVRDGKPYSRIAHLAENVTPFVAIAEALRREGFAASEIFAGDLDRGLLLIEHLGTEGIVDAEGKPIPERYLAAAELLADLHGRAWPSRLPVKPGLDYAVPPYDPSALAIETELATDWYLPAYGTKGDHDDIRTRYPELWRGLIERLGQAEKSLVLRDYHSPNIIWRGERAGSDRLAIIDFQDALIGPSAYDVASLALDARVTIPRELERQIVETYCTARTRNGPFDRKAFDEAYAIVAAQRNSKILGIFVRLDVRDGKPQYLKHLPRIRDYLARALAHPALSDLRALYRQAGFVGPA